MSNELEVFNYNGNNVRTVIIDGNVWFVAKDICDVLEIKNVPDAVSELDNDEKMTIANTDSHSGQRGGAQKFNVISESGVYALVFKSRKPEAKQFSRWVRHEVLPAIRKTGSYGNPELNPVNIRAAEVLQKLAQMLSGKIEQRGIINEAVKLVTGRGLPASQKYYTAREIAVELKLTAIGVMRKAKAFGLLDDPENGRWDGETWYFSERGCEILKQDMPEKTVRYWTVQQIASSLKWPIDAVMYRAENLGITKKARNGYFDGETWYFSKEGRKKFLELVGQKIIRIKDGFAYYEDGHKFIHWSYDADEAGI